MRITPPALLFLSLLMASPARADLHIRRDPGGSVEEPKAKYKRIRDVILLFFLVMFESFGYRQVVALCRVVATVRYFSGKILSYLIPVEDQW